VPVHPLPLEHLKKPPQENIQLSKTWSKSEKILYSAISDGFSQYKPSCLPKPRYILLILMYRGLYEQLKASFTSSVSSIFLHQYQNRDLLVGSKFIAWPMPHWWKNVQKALIVYNSPFGMIYDRQSVILLWSIKVILSSIIKKASASMQ
jgi:hypothetical protein